MKSTWCFPRPRSSLAVGADLGHRDSALRHSHAAGSRSYCDAIADIGTVSVCAKKNEPRCPRPARVCRGMMCGRREQVPAARRPVGPQARSRRQWALPRGARHAARREPRPARAWERFTPPAGAAGGCTSTPPSSPRPASRASSAPCRGSWRASGCTTSGPLFYVLESSKPSGGAGPPSLIATLPRHTLGPVSGGWATVTILDRRHWVPQALPPRRSDDSTGACAVGLTLTLRQPCILLECKAADHRWPDASHRECTDGGDHCSGLSRERARIAANPRQSAAIAAISGTSA
jgi:hypothetical protein